MHLRYLTEQEYHPSLRGPIDDCLRTLATSLQFQRLAVGGRLPSGPFEGSLKLKLGPDMLDYTHQAACS